MSILGIDLGGTRIKLGVIENGVVNNMTVIEIESNANLTGYFPDLNKNIDRLLHNASGITGIGMAFPGIVDSVRNVVIGTSEKYDDAPSMDFSTWAKDKWGLPLRIENDARLACLGEWKFGVGNGYSDMVMCTLGTGVGSAAIIDNQLLKGRHYQAGILGGHSIIDYTNQKYRCSCGGYGCVEVMASTWMIKHLAEKSPLFKDSRLNSMQKTDLAAVFECSVQGDELSITLRDQCMYAWAVGIINLIHAYDPEVVVIGGGIMHSRDILLPYFKKMIDEKAWCPSRQPNILASCYPDTAALLGASTLFE